MVISQMDGIKIVRKIKLIYLSKHFIEINKHLTLSDIKVTATFFPTKKQ